MLERGQIDTIHCLVEVEGGLISEFFTLCIQSPKKMPNYYPDHFSPKQNML